MSENNVPVLTLDSEGTAKSALEAAVAQLEAPQAPNADKEVAQALDETFTPEELEQIKQFAGKIDVTNPDHVMLYGADAQKKVSEFSDTILASVKNTDSGEVGDILTKLITELKGFDGVTDQPKGLAKLFFSAKKQMAAIQARYDVVSANVETIAGNLEQHQVQLLKDVAMFNQLYDKNLEYFRELSMYIAAGEMRLAEVRATDLEALRKKAEETGDTMDAQAAKDLADQCDRFEKKIRGFADGSADPHAAKQQRPAGGAHSVHPGQHPAPVEKPDGAGHRSAAFAAGHEGAEGRHRRHQRAAAQERGDPQTGHVGHRQGGRARHHRSGNPHQDQPGSDRYHHRGQAHPGRGPRQAPGGRKETG